MIEAFPLDWPLGYKRAVKRIESKFKQGMEQSQQFLREEIRRLNAKSLIVSTNIPIRKDGGMYVEYMSRRLPDPGVAIFFKYKDSEVVMCCDHYERVWENIYALGKGIEAIRGMERWGVSDFIERAFTGFKALPAPPMAPICNWWDILEILATSNSDEIKQAYRKLAAKYHPDNQGTGNAEKFIQVQKAYEQAISQF